MFILIFDHRVYLEVHADLDRGRLIWLRESVLVLRDSSFDATAAARSASTALAGSNTQFTRTRTLALEELPRYSEV